MTALAASAPVSLLGGLLGHAQRPTDRRPRHAGQAVVRHGAGDLSLDARQLGAEVTEALRAVLGRPSAALLLAPHPVVAEVMAHMPGRNDLADTGGRVGARGLVMAVDSGRVPVGSGDAVPGRHASTVVDVRPSRQDVLTHVLPAADGGSDE